ncbi:hypothetical protein Ddye_005730 [Dipteronia dyeriana]|uniref:Uncharacterized protein n=1 Tax=Dipteronia dyeriana TaxID=168575 RepID=A0AAD9XH24_9ROSI|nr:hypothetical protein Ddye_005730 [Dipteronia dyeriana]
MEQFMEDRNQDNLNPNRRRNRLQAPRRKSHIRDLENLLKTDTPGSLQLEEFSDWLATVEEVSDSEGVPKDKFVPLVATRLRNRTAAWWQQLKLSRNSMGKAEETPAL